MIWKQEHLYKSSLLYGTQPSLGWTVIQRMYKPDLPGIAAKEKKDPSCPGMVSEKSHCLKMDAYRLQGSSFNPRVSKYGIVGCLGASHIQLTNYVCVDPEKKKEVKSSSLLC